jgi:D-serine deaminase-like pyridoxal phosphate-dependent protein
MDCHWDYGKIKSMLLGRDLPAMLVNLDCLDYNIANVRAIAETSGKNIRIASKSIRVPYLLQYIKELGGNHFRGIMCYSVREAAFLHQKGFDDLLVAYPTSSQSDLEVYFNLRETGASITLMVDSREQVELIREYWNSRGKSEAPPALLCIDVDMSYRPLGLHLGVYRSSIMDPSDFERLLDHILNSGNVELAGVMGYEAQIAGMGDKSPFKRMLNPVKRVIRNLSVKDVRTKRELVQRILEKRGVELKFFNGGGSGSIHSTSRESCITEVTVGSGFLQSHLFDYYGSNRNEPAFCFALPVDRKPRKHVVTCKSGGFIASGETGRDKAPLPFLPGGMKAVPNEGFGEVQTPLKISGNHDPQLGDPLLFRPAKAGEIAEHFQQYILFRDDSIVDSVTTYRGEGMCFY